MRPVESPSAPIRVLLADDHAMLREGLAALIDGAGDMLVVAHTGTAQGAVEEAQKIRADVAVVDLVLPGSGLRALSTIAATCPETRVLALSVLDDLEHVRAALAAGAAGYVVKRAAATELLSAIRAAHEGRSHVGINAQLQRRLKERPAVLPECTASLSDRERAVLRLLAWGHTHREIGVRLGLSKKTVDLYRTRLSEKLGVRGRAELVRYAVAAGIFGEPPSDA